MAKTALVVSGGGSKGAFAVGAIEVLAERGLRFDIVTGTSTGALVAPLVATGDVALLHTIYTTVRTEDILVLRRGIDILAGDAIYDSTPLWNLINRQMTEQRYARLLAAAADVFVCATNLQDGKSYFWNPKRGQDGRPLSRDTFNRAIFASSSQPVLMPAIRIPPQGGDQYVDGGLREVAPIRKAIDEGADSVYAIVLSPEQHQRLNRSFVFVVDTLKRALDVVLEEVVLGDVAGAALYNEVLDFVRAARQRAAAFVPPDQLDAVFAASPAMQQILDKKLVELHVIRPDTDLPMDGLEFDPAVMTQALQLGRAAAQRTLG